MNLEPSVENRQKPCEIDSMCYEILQKESTDNWKDFFREGNSLPKDSINLCVVDSLFNEFVIHYNMSLATRFERDYEKDSLIAEFSLKATDYCVQIVSYHYKDEIQMLLSCLHKDRINDYEHWRHNYFGMLSEKGMGHFYLTLNQTARKIVYYKP
ncbi:MAG: hypothetical protein AB8E82_17350 [Aureispira sp.]